ncbi:MAG: DNA-binding protein [Thermoprotei archaeon]|nr:MAG: DNA-binding protein [Thermoprotei archaeon]RLF23607.1 MAG: DNA-binding protein [Thermoprotei archaeon]
MSSNEELALSYLEDAKYSYEEAIMAFKRKLYHRCIRRAQECVELSLKALLRLYGVEYPRTREVSSSLIRIRDKLPPWFRQELDFVIEASTWLATQRVPSFYGDEYRRLPAKRLFKEGDAAKALEYAKRLLEMIEKVIREWLSR